MVKITEQVQLIVSKELDKKITRSQLIKATEAAAREAIDLIRYRTTNEGVDLNGKKLPKLSEKEPFKYSYGFRKRNDLNSLLRGKQTTQFKAKGFPNHMRLSGQLYSAMKYKLAGIKTTAKMITATFELFFKGDQSKKIEWLASTKGATRGWGGRGKKKVYTKPSRVWFGICTAANRRRKELDKISKAFMKVLGLSTGVTAR